jgi:hypothetical protein
MTMITTRTACAPEWPLTIERGLAGRPALMLADGRRTDLDAFRNECRERAQEMRRQAMADAVDVVLAALRRVAGAAAHLVRPAIARKASAGAHGI